MILRKHSLLSHWAIVCLLVLFCCCSDSKRSGDVVLNGVLLGIPDELTSSAIISNIQWYFLDNLGLKLVAYNEEDKLIPQGCASWEISADKKKYTFHLRKNLKDSSGTPLTAHDWVRTFVMLFHTGTTHTSFTESIGTPDHIMAVDDHTLVIQLEKVTPSLLYRLTTPEFILLSSKQNVHDKTLQNFRISTGAYFLSDISPEKVSLKASKHFLEYNHKQPQVIHLFTSPDSLDGLVDLYRSEKVDFSLYPAFPFDDAFSEVEDLVHKKQLIISDVPLQSLAMMILNPNSSVFSRREKRIAFLAAWQKLTIPELNTVISKRSHQFIPEGFLGYSLDMTDTPFFQITNQNLPKKITGIMTPVVAKGKIDQVVMPYFKKMGIQASIETVSYSGLIEKVRDPSHDLFLATMGMNVKDLPGSMMSLFGSHDSNTAIQDPDGSIHKMLEDVIREDNDGKKHMIMMQFQKKILEEALVVPLMYCEPNLLMYTSHWRLPSNANRKDRFKLHMFRGLEDSPASSH